METLQKTVEAKNLQKIYKNAHQNMMFSGFGVILDATHVYKANNQYFVRIKVIDKSLNHVDNADGDKQPIVVLLFAHKSRHQLPRVNCLGSVCRFRNLQFSDRKKYVQGTSNGDKNSFKVYTPEEFHSRKKAKAGSEFAHAQTLYLWGQSYFKVNSLLSMEWFQKSEEMSVEEFDYLLRNTGTTLRGRRFIFEDLYGKQIVYDIPEKMTKKDFDFVIGDVVKLRSLAAIQLLSISNQSKELQAYGNKYTSLMRLPKSFKDCREQTQEEEKPQKGKKKQQKPVLHTLDVAKSIYIPRHELDTYGINKKMLLNRIAKIWGKKQDLESFQVGSLIRTDYLDLNITDMGYLLRGSLDQQTYHVRGYIHCITPDKIENMVRKYCCQCNEQFNIGAVYSKCPRCNGNLKNIYLFKIMMKDLSIQYNKQFFEAYVFTYDEYPSPSDFFPRICLRDFENCMKNGKDLADHMNSLLKQLPLKINVSYDFVVQAQVSYDDPNNVIYRIIDSFMVM